jgi:hypothetical protein
VPYAVLRETFFDQLLKRGDKLGGQNGQSGLFTQGSQPARIGPPGLEAYSVSQSDYVLPVCIRLQVLDTGARRDRT